MHKLFAIYKKEFTQLFTSPVGYIFIIFFVLITHGIFFVLNRFFDVGVVSMRPFFSLLPWIYLFFIPAFSMSMWAGEKSIGTVELLFTLPIKEWHAVTGKFLAGLSFLGVALLATFTVPLTLTALGNPDTGAIFASYFGAFLTGGAYLAAGLFLSSLCKNQITAFILSVSVIFVLLLIGSPDLIGMVARWFVETPWLAKVMHVMSYLSLITHYENIAKGVIDTRDLIYYLIFIVFFLMLNIRYLQNRKWK
jgi:ABC-2 type transport system permease protein